MLFNYKYLDKFDASEDCIVSKIFMGLIFNKYVPANREWELAREFIKYYLDDLSVFQYLEIFKS